MNNKYKIFQQGSSMIEILVALLIVSISMLAIASLQLKTVSNNIGQFERSSAVMMSYSMMDRLRIDKQSALAGKYDFNFPAVEDVCEAKDLGSTRAQNQINKWIAELQKNLGDDSCGQIACQTDGECQVSVRWNDSMAAQGKETEVISTKSVL